MITIEMSCGGCESSISIAGDDKESEQIWHLTHRFTAAHTTCGFIKPPSVDNEAHRPMKKRFIQPFSEDNDE
jgi:hypothetical protein